jgi:dihydroorotate dehydrogenase
LRELQGPAALSQLLRAIRDENRKNTKPVLVKIAPDLSSNELDELMATCEENEIGGIIATNTTLDHSSIPSARDQEGGLSGAPLREKSTAVVRTIAARSTIPVVASGGISDAESAREKFAAGARLLQIYTGYIYRGPSLLREIMENLS